MRGDEFDAVHLVDALSPAFKSRIVRWWPGAYDDDPTANFMLTPSVSGVSEWTHEREWRLPRPADITDPWSWSFTPQDVAFCLVPSVKAADEVKAHLRAFGENPAVQPSDLSWLAQVPIAYRPGDAWVFAKGMDVRQRAPSRVVSGSCCALLLM